MIENHWYFRPSDLPKEIDQKKYHFEIFENLEVSSNSVECIICRANVWSLDKFCRYQSYLAKRKYFNELRQIPPSFTTIPPRIESYHSDEFNENSLKITVDPEYLDVLNGDHEKIFFCQRGYDTKKHLIVNLDSVRSQFAKRRQWISLLTY
ncbi:hypothetical protein O9G_002844 [Rozella allomycis CSF55]|uniref:BAH domain-containing protein n=1 Tax=Rozella allomycis (strain CSF55) TaxID=988480 RepID=A0A075ARL0_ROZAC|nr:hypothetical protein O9G_002844 [Rozella allomycis CSF55]|eukprot:EPZ32926.1 hypothetical protein O9G_002844 [Rozella allomycis CSF55]